MDMINLWDDYKKELNNTLSLYNSPSSTWVNWTSYDGTRLVATHHYPKHFIKSREVEIWDEGKSYIYNNIIYPKTGSNLPCFGMDLMGFFEKKVIIVFDFQHPVENYLFSHPDLPKAEGTFRFFEPGNHFSENVFVRKCTMSEVNNYLDDFVAYLQAYKEMVESEQPSGMDTQTTYRDFDTYMKKLDPVSGYLSSKFGKEKAEQLVNDFLFCYE